MANRGKAEAEEEAEEEADGSWREALSGRDVLSLRRATAATAFVTEFVLYNSAGICDKNRRTISDKPMF